LAPPSTHSLGTTRYKEGNEERRVVPDMPRKRKAEKEGCARHRALAGDVIDIGNTEVVLGGERRTESKKAKLRAVLARTTNTVLRKWENPRGEDRRSGNGFEIRVKRVRDTRRRGSILEKNTRRMKYRIIVLHQDGSEKRGGGGTREWTASQGLRYAMNDHFAVWGEKKKGCKKKKISCRRRGEER